MLFIDPIPNRLLFIVVTIIVFLFIAIVWLNYKKWDNNCELIKILGGYDLSTFRRAMKGVGVYDIHVTKNVVEQTRSEVPVPSSNNKLDSIAKSVFIDILNNTDILIDENVSHIHCEYSANIQRIPFEKTIYMLGGEREVDLNTESLKYINWSDNFVPDAIINYIFDDNKQVSVLFEFDENNDFHSVRGKTTNLNYIKKTLNYNSMTIKNKGENKVIVVRITYKNLSDTTIKLKDKTTLKDNFKHNLRIIIKFIHRHIYEICSYFRFEGGYILSRLDVEKQIQNKTCIIDEQICFE